LNIHRQHGLTTVEFAIVGAVALTVLIGCIEMGRIFFVWNTLAESTRRAARLAAICPVNDLAIKRNALLNPPGSTANSSAIMAGLSTANIALTYLDAAGGVTAVQTDMRFVRAEIVGYDYTLFIPYVTPTITAPPFRTTVPVESLGYIPETGANVCMG
jgi:Flp pilus assembly protein TadG